MLRQQTPGTARDKYSIVVLVFDFTCLQKFVLRIARAEQALH